MGVDCVVLKPYEDEAAKAKALFKLESSEKARDETVTEMDIDQLITGIAPRSPAEEAAALPGIIITNTPVDEEEEHIEEIEETKETSANNQAADSILEEGGLG
jgi:hypothetical protein